MSDQTSVLRDEVSASANRLRAAGDSVQEAGGKVGACSFGSGSAGREYGGEGSTVQTAVAKLGTVISAWQTANTDVADEIIGAVHVYTEQEDATAGAVSGVVA